MRTAILCLALAAAALAEQALVPPTDFEVRDRPNDDGKFLLFTWKQSPSSGKNVKYVLYVATSATGPWVVAAEQGSMEGYQKENPKTFGFGDDLAHAHFLEVNSMPDSAKEGEKITFASGTTYFFRLEIVRGDQHAVVGTGSASPAPNWWDWSKTNILVGCVGFCALVLFLIRHARKNPNMFIRRIPGLDAVDEAIGRATEMGKPVLYLNGLLGMDSISTIASTAILGRLARRIALYDSQILVPCYDPVVLPVCQEVVREAYLDAGRPDAYREESIYFLTNDQFSYVAAIDGLMMREKPAANFYFGYYYAESLLLAETGAATGAIQIAGTDSVTQVPFFIAACDYCLIGEELYAAGAYLSKDPLQLGSLKGQDFGKAALIVLILLGAILKTLSTSYGWHQLDFIEHWFRIY